MKLKTLNTSIFRLVGGLLSLSTCAILIAVWISTTNHARTQITQGLDVGQNIITQVLDSREEQLLSSAEVLTADFGFIESIASRDEATITSVLHNHGARISADLMALLKLDGSVISSTSRELDNDTFVIAGTLIEAAVSDGGAISILRIDEKLYQVILLTINAPAPIAIAVIGFEMNQALIDELTAITKLHTTIEAHNANGGSITISSLPEHELDNVFQSVARELELLRSPFARDNRFLSKRFLLSETGGKTVWIILSEDLNELFSEFNLLQLEITLITLLSIGLAMLLGAVFAKNLTRPLTDLAAMAQRIARGDYHKSIDMRCGTYEIDNLSASFGVMQENVSEREEKIRYQASHDLLTHLYNRFQITEIIQEKIASGEPFQVFGLNIIGFRGINDMFGYRIGDSCLQLIAARFMKLDGYAARLNGGELMWLPDRCITDTELTIIRAQLEQPLDLEKTILNMRFAIGLVRYPDDTVDSLTLFRRVSIAVDHARQNEQLFQVYRQDLEESYLYRLEVLRELKHSLSISQSELNVFYQPKLHLRSGKVSKVEALMRWNSKRLGVVSPELFISIAEQAGFIRQVTDWLVRRVIHDLQNWRQAGVNLQVAVNLSVQDVMNRNLLPSILRQLDRAGLDNKQLSFEITESDLMKEPGKAITQMQAFNQNGFNLAIDDFGTGYSSLAYLKSMPVSELKIDKSFILHLDQRIDDQNIVQTIIALARTFHLEIVAEGVENEETLRLLNSWQCDWIQGFYISKPIARDEIKNWLHTFEANAHTVPQAEKTS